MAKTINTEICFIGGDERQKYAAVSLSEHMTVNVVGEVFKDASHTNINIFDNPLKAIYNSKAVILPLPATASENILPFSELVKNIKDRTVLGGRFSPYFKGTAETANIRFKDYYEDESFTIKNAFLTAEGAISLAMQATKNAIRHSKCAIIGYGRIGKALGDTLKALNAQVTVWARREEALALASENGLKVNKISKIDNLYGLAWDTDVIFNTVPERIIPNEVLLAIPAGTLLIELASQPGGFDPDIASQCELKFIDGRGLPAKYAPIAAGRILAETIIQHLKQEELL